MSFQNQNRPKTSAELLYEFVTRRFLSIVGVLMLGTALGILLGYDLGIPRWLRLSAVTMIVLSPFAYVVGSSIVDLLPDPDGVFLVDVDARQMDGAVFWLPTAAFHDLDVVDGDLNQVAPSLYFGKQVDLEEMTAIGTWRGTMSDRQLIRGLQKVYECRGQLEDDAKKGFVLETQAFSLVRNAVRDTTATVVDTFRKGTLPDDGDGLDDAVENAIEQFDLDEVVDDANLDDDLELSDELLDPDGDRDLQDQAEDRVADRVDQGDANGKARAEVANDD